MARNNLPSLFFLGALFCLLYGCSSSNQNSIASCHTKHDVYLGVTNSSLIDTLAYAEISIDDSLAFNQKVRLLRLSSTNFQKTLKLCEGAHRIKAKFGRYVRDTIIVISSKTSLIVSMDYETVFTENNGLMIVALERNGDPNGTAPD